MPAGLMTVLVKMTNERTWASADHSKPGKGTLVS
jgi:hypothetical protein